MNISIKLSDFVEGDLSDGDTLTIEGFNGVDNGEYILRDVNYPVGKVEFRLERKELK